MRPKAAQAEIATLAHAVSRGDRRALGRAITLVESARPDHRARADALLDRIMPATGKAVRIGISGAPGVGKSTFIEAFGLHIIGREHRVAVLAVDPSSTLTGGSILGDKTRMEDLARHEAAYIRPTPSRGTLGGVARRTRQAALVCEAAGFDVILIETVGVGQSETAVAEMVDTFILLLQPAAGDELQGFKRGILELADLVVVTKADGALEDAAAHTVADYRAALQLLRPPSPSWRPRVLACSSFAGTGIADVWAAVEAYLGASGDTAETDDRRAQQARAWMWREILEALEANLRARPGADRLIGDMERAVRAGRLTPSAAARELLERLGGDA